MSGRDVGFRACRACGARNTSGTKAAKAQQFKRIPDDDPCAAEGAHFEGEDVHAAHACSRYLCNPHFLKHQRLAAENARVEFTAVTSDALPADRSCAVCARLLINQRSALEYEQVADVCCEVMCAACAGEKFVTSVRSGMHCGKCAEEVRGWDVRPSGCAPARRVDVPPPITWRQYPRLRAMHEGAKSGTVGMQVIWYGDDGKPQTSTSVFSVDGDAEHLVRARARSGLLQLVRLLHPVVRRGRPADVECLNAEELDVAADLRKRTFMYRLVHNLVTGRDQLPSRAEIKRNPYSRRSHNICFCVAELVDRAMHLRYEGAMSSFVQALFSSPAEGVRAAGFARLGLASHGQGRNKAMDAKLAKIWTAEGGTATQDAILDLDAGEKYIGCADNVGSRRSAATGSGFVQQTVSQIRSVPREQLRFAGGSRKNLLMLSSMKSRDVSTVNISECLPNEKDAQYLTARRDALFLQVLEARRDVLAVGEGLARKTRRRFTVRTHSTVPYDAASGPVRRLRATVHGKRCGGSHLAAGNIKMDYCIAADWSKNDTVSAYMSRVGAIAAKTLAKTPRAGTVWAGEEPHPMTRVPTVMAGDGKPVSQAEIMGQAAHAGRLWDAGKDGIHGVVAENGGFHIILKGLELNGANYGSRSVGPRGYNAGEGMLPSEGRVAYYERPSDPRVPLQRQAKNVAAFYYDAIDAFVAKHGVEPSAAELDLFVLARAQACPAYDYELHVIRDIEVVLATCDMETAGAVGDADGFERMTRLLMNLFARTHATGYFPMIAGRILRRLTESESEAAWHREFGFTTPSKNGIPMFVDKSVEMTVRFLRRWVGHRVRVGHEARMRRVMRFLKELIESSQIDACTDTPDQPRSSFDETHKTLELDADFWKCLDAYRATDVAGGAQIHPLAKVGRKTRPPAFDKAEMRTIVGALIHPQDLTQHTIADKRCHDYMTSLLDSARRVGSSYNVPMVGLGGGKPGGVDIGFVGPDAVDDIRLRQAQWDQQYSTDATLLAGGKMPPPSRCMLMTKADLVREVLKLHALGLPSLASHTKHGVQKLDSKSLARDLASGRQEFALFARAAQHKYPPTERPQDAAAGEAIRRLTHHGVVPLPGHGPCNANPDHSTVFFRRSWEKTRGENAGRRSSCAASMVRRNLR